MTGGGPRSADAVATRHLRGDVTGIVLAAGAGTRIGSPKALLSTPDGDTWLSRATAVLDAAGCARVLVVLGARAAEARPLIPPGARVVVAEDWSEGMSASLRAALRAATGDAALITLVDLPGMPAEVAVRIAGVAGVPSDGGDGADGRSTIAAGPGRVTPDSLRQAVYDGRPGHPVLVGSNHWPALIATLQGDRGARAYLREHRASEVECSDLWDGHDIDRN